MSNLDFDWLLFAVLIAAMLAGLIAGIWLRYPSRDGKSPGDRDANAN
jgi:hypothetical protein